MILNEEWARQALMEQDLSIPSALLSPPVRETVEIGKGLLGFMNMIVIPLFQGVADVMPDMSTGLEQLQLNKSMWEQKIAEDQERHRKPSNDSILADGARSPRSLSIATPPVGATDEAPTGQGSAGSLAVHFRQNRPEDTSDPFKIFVDGVPHSMQESDRMSVDSRISPSHTVPETSGAFPSVSLIPFENTMNGHSSDSVFDSQGQVTFSDVPTRQLKGHNDTDGTDTTDTTEMGARGHSESANDDASESGPSVQRRRNLVNQSSSDTTDGRSGDWVSQATSATTNINPCSPSTRGTSVTSKESRDRLNVNGEQALKSRDQSSEGFLDTDPYSRRTARDEVSLDKRSAVSSETSEDNSRQPHRTLKQKSSLFRLPKFWHRKGSAEREAATVGGREKGDDGGRY